MAVHISARLAWHMDGWNGRVCGDPGKNTYCVGQHSYPGDLIAEERDLPYESDHAGECCTTLDRIPPCCYSINAFGGKKIKAFAHPPEFFNKGVDTRVWDLPPATVCVWPYEEMYNNDVRDGSYYNAERRLEGAKAFFKDVTPGSSLIFYYSNYSNPLNTEDERRYVIVGLSRVKKLGPLMFYDGTDEQTKARHGGYVWDRNVTSHYPDQGLRLPYHLYLDQPDVLSKFEFFPDNPRNFKYGTRRISDDDALDLIERFLEISGTFQSQGDRSENWSARITWLQTLVAELWQARGLYPGMAKVLDVLKFGDAIPLWKDAAGTGKENDLKKVIFEFLGGKRKRIPGLSLSEQTARTVVRQWHLRESDERRLLQEVFPKFDLPAEQMVRILSRDREQHGIYQPLKEICDNPYVLSEEFVGDNPDDMISFSKIDHGAYPSLELGGEPLGAVDDWRRLRGLAVERLKRETKHAFVSAAQVIHDVNHKLSFLPEWKRTEFTERYLAVDGDELSKALTFRQHNDRTYVYWKPIYDDEREIESRIRTLAKRPNITFRSPVTDRHWRGFLYDAHSALAERNPQQYEEAIAGQVSVCSKVFVRPICVLSGAAGTGKTTVIKALIQAIEKAHGSAASFKLLAPTGKAADRIRAATGKAAITIHSFLAEQGWLNDNLSFKRRGGNQADKYQTYIIDEASMLDLGLVATLFRAIKWPTVQRLIFVGDPNQLPPIGRGKVLADVIEWLLAEQPEAVARLETNIRQMANRLGDLGTGILDLASLYTHAELQASDDEESKAVAEDTLQRVQEGGNIDKDLRVLYWRGPDNLQKQLIDTAIADMEKDCGESLDPERPHALWRKAAEGEGDNPRADYLQILSPYRSEPFGTDHLNGVVQRHIHRVDEHRADGYDIRNLEGVMLFDKVIQIRNRPKSKPINAYNAETQKTEKVEIFNGQLGYVKPHGFDTDKWRSRYFRLERFQVAFARREHLWVGYGRKLGKDASGKWLPGESVEENLELGYAISVHKAQGSEFDRVYFVVPKHKTALLSPELFYTGLTRAHRHCTLLVEEDISPLLAMRRRENSHLISINSSLFQLNPLPDELLHRGGWYEEGKLHRALAGWMVHSKSEVIIANMLFERDIPFKYELPAYAPDRTFYLPDFTITWNGEQWFWEHWGLMDQEHYRNHRQAKMSWYERHFPGRLVETFESPELSRDANEIIERFFS